MGHCRVSTDQYMDSPNWRKANAGFSWAVCHFVTVCLNGAGLGDTGERISQVANHTNQLLISLFGAGMPRAIKDTPIGAISNYS